MRAAGDLLNVSHSVVSRHVHNLETFMGVPLVRPSGRGILLTEDGQSYFREIDEHLVAIAAATARVSSRARSL